ncbi:MAG: hypothetical protein H3C27_05875 [Opitutaceae bacterium]|nr:hypothetical protein [Opitutaceae bacterium]
MSNHDPEKLEKLIHQSLRALPERRAPRSLELRVMAAIEARQALPWWRQSFAHWPQPAKAAFFVLAGALIGLSLRSGASVEAGSILSGPLALLGQIKAILGGIGDIGALVLRQIPPSWIYGAIAFLAVMYATLIGVGATAYRVFLQQR